MKRGRMPVGPGLVFWYQAEATGTRNGVTYRATFSHDDERLFVATLMVMDREPGAQVPRRIDTGWLITQANRTPMADLLNDKGRWVDTHTLDRYTRAAVTYRCAHAVGLPTAKTIAAELGCSEAAAAQLTSRARRAGLLGDTIPGKGGV